MVNFKNFIFILILVLNINSIFPKKIDSVYLPINTFFSEIQIKLYHSLKKTKNNQVFEEIKNLNETVDLLESIIKDIDDKELGLDRETKFMFLSICLNLDKYSKPSDLRKARNDIKNLNERLSVYSKVAYNILKDKQKKLIQNIYRFNNRLDLLFLKNEFLNLSPVDHIVDIFVNRPIEFISDNPRISLFFALLIIATTSYFLVKNKIGQNISFSNKEKPIKDVASINVCRQNGANCGWHALFNTAVMLSKENKTEMEKILLDPKFVGAFIEKNKALIEDIRDGNRQKANGKMINIPDGVGWLSGGEIEKILNDYGVKKYLYDHLQVSDDNLEDIRVFDVNPSFDVKSEAVQIECLKEIVKEFKNNEIKTGLGFVIRDGRHWFASKFSKDEHGSLSACVADSLGVDRRLDSNVNRIFGWYNSKL